MQAGFTNPAEINKVFAEHLPNTWYHSEAFSMRHSERSEESMYILVRRLGFHSPKKLKP